MEICSRLLLVVGGNSVCSERSVDKFCNLLDRGRDNAEADY